MTAAMVNWLLFSTSSGNQLGPEFSDAYDFLLIAVSNLHPWGGSIETSLRYRSSALAD
ncbi:hypothetical protein FHS21_003107 [Phyllobacterium trifolii]|uniref:Uncharacterized protein n=1 Tax=Phyllobacterium trifolii TaxID=300193 RepID=A0A839UDE1_9HYPH|nr:hypothetical protein [Phyllobacterium trifolii]MBB3146691.1 hypothetical protein [Phyllobacterium trifolii]